MSAGITLATVYLSIHKPNPRKLLEVSLEHSLCSKGQPDDDLTALLGAAGAYIMTFTPMLLLLRGRTQEDAFVHQ